VRRRNKVALAGAGAAALWLLAVLFGVPRLPDAGADPTPANPMVPPGDVFPSHPIAAPPGGDDGGRTFGDRGFNGYQSPFSPGVLGAFLCPGRGADAVVLGIGGGYCDYAFERLPGRPGNTHIHCEWGGFAPIVSMWQCWRVFPGQPDHPALPDPDVIPDAFGVPWALTGPTPDNQWPPPGLAPAGEVGPPPLGAVLGSAPGPPP
jgi:hypothetical protein